MASASELHSENYHAQHNTVYFTGGMYIGFKAFEAAKGNISSPLDRIHIQQRANRESFDHAMATGVSYEHANAIFYGARAAVSMAFKSEFEGVSV